jgi:hypothetical protein
VRAATQGRRLITGPRRTIPATSKHSNERKFPEMNGMYGIGAAMMIIGSAVALAAFTLIVLAAVWLARDLGTGRRSGGQQR